MKRLVRGISREAGLRFLSRRKAACAAAVLTMALALGANSVVFSVVDAFLLSSFAMPEPDRLLVIAPVRDLPGEGEVTFAEAYPNYGLIREIQRSFADVACILQDVASWDDGEEARPLQAARVTASFFSTTRVQPQLGRVFEASDEGPSPAPVVVISDALWHGALQQDPAVIGRSLRIDGIEHTVIGVMPPGFTHPLPTDIWLPFDLPQTIRAAITGGRILAVYGRLKDGITREAATVEMVELTQRAIEASADNRDFRYTVQTITQYLLPAAQRTIVFVQAGALMLTLLAVLNLSSLLIAWGFDRRQEIAVRLALGARPGRIIRMMVFQSVVVVCAGGAAGLVLARGALPWIRQLDVTPTLALFMENLDLDLGVLLWSTGATLLAGVLAGLLPSFLSRGADPSDPLRSSSRSASLSPAAVRWQKLTVLAQAALTVVILCAAALIGISFRNLARVPAGFAAADRVVARVQLADTEYPSHESRAVFTERLLDNLAMEPELAAAAFTSTLPVGDGPRGGRFHVQLEDGSLSSEPQLFHYRRISADYLDVLGIPLVTGRAFDRSDDAAHPSVAIVSRALAERVWPDADPIGKRIYRVTAANPEPQPLEIVGVAGNVLDGGFDAPSSETVYVPFAQVSLGRISIVATPRTTQEAAIAAVRRALRATDPEIAASAVTTLESLVNRANALPRLQTILLMAFGLVAIGIVTLGSYGVMSQLVGSRERELAVRLVFGAAPARLGLSVLIQAATLTVPGIALGLLITWLLGGVLRPFVFGIDPRSASVTLLVGLATFTLVACASIAPAIRAMRMDVRKGFSVG